MRASFVAAVASLALALGQTSPRQTEHPAHHARHDARGSDGVSRFDARADAEPRPACARRRRLHARVLAGARDAGVARDAADRHVSAAPPRERFRRTAARDGSVPASAPARQRLPDRRVRRIADPRSERRHGAGFRSRIRRLRRRLPVAAAGRRSLRHRRASRRRCRRACGQVDVRCPGAGRRRSVVPVGPPLRPPRSVRSTGRLEAALSRVAVRR